MALVSSTDIANLALSIAGSTVTIASLDEKSVAGRQCKLWYDFTRRQVLESHNWGFARKRKALAGHGEDPPAEWTYRYQYPADCIKARLIENPVGWTGDAVPFDVENVNGQLSILSDLEDAKLIYTYDLTDPLLFTSEFVLAHATLLAQYIAHPVSGNRAVAREVGEQFLRVFRAATGSNAQEGHERGPRDAEGIRARA